MGDPGSKGFCAWRFDPPGHSEDAVDVHFGSDGKVCGWVDIQAGVVVGVEEMPSGAPVGRGPGP